MWPFSKKKSRFPFKLNSAKTRALEQMEVDHALMIAFKVLGVSQVELMGLKKKYPYKKLLIEKMLAMAQDAFEHAETPEEKDIALQARVMVNDIKNEEENKEHANQNDRR